MSRPLGKRIREVCQIAERIGPCRTSEIAAHTDLDANGVRAFCSRAVAWGMLIRDGRHYTAVANWREIADNPYSVKPKAPDRKAHPLETAWQGVNQ